MGSVIGGALGLAGGVNGTGVQGPQQAAITSPTDLNQIKDAYANANSGLAQQQSLLLQLNGQNGIQNQSNVYNQLQGIANGTGPNPAQAMLNNATGQNVANQAALMAAQRGAGSNVGLMARQAGMQGANLQQQAVGQGAAMQANQAMNAIGQMGSIAGQQVGNQLNATQANTAAVQAQHQALMNAQNGVNSATVNSQNSVNAANAGIAGGVMGMQGQAVGGALNAAGAGASSAGGAKGGAEGGAVDSLPMLADKIGPQSAFAKLVHGHRMPMAHGGQVPAMVAPGERYLPPQEVQAVAQGQKSPMKAGEKIPGKPVVGGAKNDYANDIVPKTLEKGGIVLPRSVTQAKDPSKKAAEFVAAVLKRESLKKGKK